MYLLQLSEPPSNSGSIYSEELVLHLNDQIRVSLSIFDCCTVLLAINMSEITPHGISHH